MYERERERERNSINVAMAGSKLQLALQFLVFFCFSSTLRRNGGEALRSSVPGSKFSPARTWRGMMPHNATSGSNSLKGTDVNSYFPGSNTVLHFAVCESYPAQYYGGRGVFSVHPLYDVGTGQETSGSVWIGNSMQEIIEAGWHVRPELYGDTQVHFYITWTAAASGTCFNLNCPGFVVREGSSIVPGSILPSRTHMRISIRKDSSNDWRLNVDGAEVGRWPGTLFTRLNSDASFISFGGRAEFLKGAAHSPPMGSGHFPGDVSSSASIRNLQFFDRRQGSFVDLKLGDVAVKADARECYDAMLLPARGGLNFFYGGPGGCTNYN